MNKPSKTEGKVNRIVLCREDYLSQEEFENEILKAVMLLINAGYITTVKYDDRGLGIVCFDFNYENRGCGCEYPYWLSPTEFESVIWDNERDEQAK